ncbi:MAG: hypothetical protein M3Q96_00975, partial [Pseudomonadota bacterium]|nr:hypothetical protein [Pseudomonadota bacterium]
SAPTTGTSTPVPTTGTSAPVRTKPAPPMSDPLPPEVMPAPASTNQPPVINQTCRTSADCVVKDVGNCCGAMPACVNRNSRTDPAAVRAECARKGMASVCGFSEIKTCTCANGQCISEQEPVDVSVSGAPPSQTDR